MFSSALKLNIANATLKRLTISFCLQYLEIVIKCPALEYLNYYLRDRQSVILLAKQSLVEVVIDGYCSQDPSVPTYNSQFLRQNPASYANSPNMIC